ncbi:hypothetical protein OG799_14780 [Micromonospora sp. NBC_00898]|uniref:hypothetical protein n=1 Tax=Micromonospora sp. NBC_00898 TaxID=2975981 RepID=UPI00386C1D44|nr:hypothetical protein OG799_14780 [Micromonospora sp. NBC_00898]
MTTPGAGAAEDAPMYVADPYPGQDVWVANMVGQRGTRRGGAGPPIRYDAAVRPGTPG